MVGQDNSQRYQNLEGLRGLAALVVVFWHFVIAFLPFLVGFAAVTRHTKFDHIISNSPLFLPFAGSFSVLVFFVLSGFVLSLSFFKTRDSSVLTAAASRRYLRLMIPALGSVILAFVIMSVGHHAHLVTAQATGSPWLTWFWNFPPNLFEALRQGAFGAFFNNQRSYNTNLWTMYIELTGSFLVFGILAFFGSLQKRWLIYLALVFIFIHSYFLAFLLGIMICDVWHNQSDVKEFFLGRSVALTLLLLALLAGSWHYTFNIYGGFYSHLTLPFFTAAGTELLVRTLGAGALIIAVLSIGWLSRFFETKPLQYLGKISFSLYLIHFAVIYSFSCVLFNRLLPHFGYMFSFITMLALSLPVILLISHYYTRFVDAPAISYSKRAGSWLVSSVAPKPKIATQRLPDNISEGPALEAAPVE